MKLQNKTYDILKWIALICIPALSTFYVACASIWGWPYADQISKTANALTMLIGALIGISTAEYRKADSSKGAHEK